MPAFSCSVPRGIPRLSFFFSPASDAGLFVCLFPGIECRLSFVLFPAVFRGFLSSFPRHRMPAPVSILPDAIRPFRMSILRRLLLNYQSPITNNHMLVICWSCAGYMLYTFDHQSRFHSSPKSSMVARWQSLYAPLYFTCTMSPPSSPRRKTGWGSGKSCTKK